MNKKNWLLIVLACVVTLTSFSSCSDDDEEDTATDNGPTEWVQGSAFDGSKRDGAASFQIGAIGYVVGGIDINNERLADAWAFTNDSWKKIADFPGGARNAAVGFSANGKGYVGLGFNGTQVFNDFYEYTPASNTWKKVADFPGEARYGATAFNLGNNGYVGLGANRSQTTFKDFYKYDAASNTWSTVETIFKNKRVNAFAFVVGTKAYVGGGQDNNYYAEDFYSFDGTKWAEETPLKDASSTYDATRQNASTFVIGNSGFIVGGNKGSVVNSVWKYDTTTKKWESKHQALPRNAREGAVAFSIDSKGVLTTGKNSANKFDDTWIFTQVR